MTSRHINQLKKQLKAREITYGLWVGMANNIAVEICAQSEFDWLLIDSEHSPLTDKDILSCLQAIAPYGVHPIVRPVVGSAERLKKLCDIGVQTFLVPMVDTAEQARLIVEAVRYPPSGTRGLGTSMARAARWNMVPDYFDWANDEMCVICQVETLEGLKNIQDIAKVEGVDMVFVGPSDLGAALGYPGQPMHEEVIAVVSQALKDIRSAGKPAGVLCVDPKLAQHYIDCGAVFVGVGSDCGILAKGAARLATNFKSEGTEKGDY